MTSDAWNPNQCQGCKQTACKCPGAPATAVLVDYDNRAVEKSPIEISYHDSLLVASHNVTCAVCSTRSAVLDNNTGRFLPCWRCQSEGWLTLKLRPFWQGVLNFFGALS